MKEALDFCDVLMIPKLGSGRVEKRNQVSLICEYTSNRYIKPWVGIPIMTSNMYTVGTFEVSRIFSKYKMLTVLHKHYELEDFKKSDYDSEYTAVSCGTSDFEKTKQILEYNPNIRWIVLDVANGYLKSFSDFVNLVSNQYPDKFIVAGNVVCKSGTDRLLDSGADLVKIGIGSGSVCLTREKTGIGYPQYSALDNICKYDRGVYSRNIVSDGGCKTPGDIAKAFGVGAKFVMIGGMLAGHDETGEVFYGMSSDKAMADHYGHSQVPSYKTSEGKTVMIKNKGPLENTIQDILGGLRSACTYTDSERLTDFIGNAEFVVVRRVLNDLFGAGS